MADTLAIREMLQQVDIHHTINMLVLSIRINSITGDVLVYDWEGADPLKDIDSFIEQMHWRISPGPKTKQSPLKELLANKIKQRQALHFDKNLLGCFQGKGLKVELADGLGEIEIFGI